MAVNGKRTYRVGIVGCRSRGKAAAAAYHAHPRTEVVGLCDLMEERRNSLGDLLGVDARFSDLDEMIRKTSPDIVVVATGTAFHYDLCMQVLEHGVNVEVEKPICIDLVQADRMVAKAEEKGVITAVHQQGRTGPAMQAVKAAFREGRVGALRYVTASDKGYYGGYGLMNIGTHLINAMLELTGPCREVSAVGLAGGRGITPEDVRQSPGGMGTIAGEHITATLRFDGNVTGTLRQHRRERIDTDGDAIEFHGEDGRLFWHENGSAFWLPVPHYIPSGGKGEWQELATEMPAHYDPVRSIGPERASTKDDYCFVDEFVRALDEGREHTSNWREGRHVLEVMMGIFESAAYRTPVVLPQTRRDHPLLRWRDEAGLGPVEQAPVAYGAWLESEDERLRAVMPSPQRT